MRIERSVGWWKPYEDLNDWQKEEARAFIPDDYRNWSYYFDGVILVAAAK